MRLVAGSKILFALTLAAALLVAVSPASAAFVINITVDENGNGTINGFNGLQPLQFALQNDPGPGGLNNVLTYDLLSAPGLVAGDVLLQDPNGLVLDVIRFNPNQVGAGGGTGTLVFYSDNSDGADSLGDTPSPPGAFYTNSITIPETGTETDNGAIYTPLAGQPGFVAGAAAPVSYTFISDGAGPNPVPEPASLTLLGLGVAGISLRAWRRKV